MTERTTIPAWKNGKISESDLILVPLGEFLAGDRSDDSAPVLAAGDALDDLIDGLGGDLTSLPVIALQFPSFADGRSYSKAQLLRTAHGYEGEIRAVGDVLPDQIELMLRVGFDALEASHPVTRTRLEARQDATTERHMQIATAVEEKPAGRFSWRQVG